MRHHRLLRVHGAQSRRLLLGAMVRLKAPSAEYSAPRPPRSTTLVRENMRGLLGFLGPRVVLRRGGADALRDTDDADAKTRAIVEDPSLKVSNGAGSHGRRHRPRRGDALRRASPRPARDERDRRGDRQGRPGGVGAGTSDDDAVGLGHSRDEARQSRGWGRRGGGGGRLQGVRVGWGGASGSGRGRAGVRHLARGCARVSGAIAGSRRLRGARRLRLRGGN